MNEDMDITQPNMLPSPESNQENSNVAAKKMRGKRTAKFGKPKSAARKATGTTNAAGVKKVPARKKGKAVARVPLKDQTNIQQASDTEEVDDLNTGEDDVLSKMTSGDELSGAKPAAKQGKGRRPAQPEAPLKEHRPTIEDSFQVQRVVDEDGEFEYTPTQNRQSIPLLKPTTRPRGRPKAASKEPVVIPESQMESLPIESSMPIPGQDSDAEGRSTQPIQRTTHFRAGSKQRQPYRHRAGSASSTEGPRAGNDPTLRRRLGEMTRKLETLEVKYQTLRDVGITEASENFSRLQASAASERKAAAEVIASLKRDVAIQRSLAQEARLLQQQLTTKDKDLESANAKANVLSANLAETQNENKALQARLSAQRNASTAVESIDAVNATRGGVPGSAVKSKAQQLATRTIMVGSAEAAHQAQVAQLKEDLYADLTGLILRGVEKGDDGDVYDCIQTGRNGRGKGFPIPSIPYIFPSLTAIAPPVSLHNPLCPPQRSFPFLLINPFQPSISILPFPQPPKPPTTKPNSPTLRSST